MENLFTTFETKDERFLEYFFTEFLLVSSTYYRNELTQFAVNYTDYTLSAAPLEKEELRN